MREYRHTIPAPFAGRQVKEFLRQQGYSSRMMTQLKKTDNGIRLNGVHARTVDLLREGDQLCLRLRDAPPPFSLCDRPVEVLYEDADLLVFNKPSGMSIHPCCARQDNTLANVFAAHLAKTGEHATFRALNRLDRDTSGAVLVAKNQHAAGLLTGRFQKSYIGITQGWLEPPEGVCDAPIIREDPMRMKRAVAPGGQRAVTRYETLARGEGASLVRFHLETGRTHQIRVHMSHLGHPLAGDTLYGGQTGLLERQGLHCEWVAFRHPFTGEDLRICAKLPEDLLRAVQNAGLQG